MNFSMNSEREINDGNLRMVGGRQNFNRIDEVKEDTDFDRLEFERLELERRRQQIENLMSNRKRIIEELKESRELKDMGANDERLQDILIRRKNFLSEELVKIRQIFANLQDLPPTREEFDSLVEVFNSLYNIFPDLFNDDEFIQNYNLEDVLNDIYDMNNFWSSQNLSSNRDLTNNVELPRQ